MERVQRSLSLGLQTIMLRGLGTVPGPVVFGFVMDSTCLLWRQQEDECGGGGRAGACLVYDNAAMSLSVLGRIQIQFHSHFREFIPLGRWVVEFTPGRAAECRCLKVEQD